ncbi:hypothetical protein QYM36_009521 [Artemia franciscana]|nr:hypothetical protein QYM36_009521 [Artemia franciscana]
MKAKLGLGSSAKKIDSPYAKYTHGGLLLSCSLCNISIKSELFWTAHISGRQHRENLAKLQKPQSSSKTALGVKRKADFDDGPAVKRKETLPEDFFDKSDSRVKPASSFVKPKSILKNKPTAVQDSKLPTTSMPTLGNVSVSLSNGKEAIDIGKPSKSVDTTLPEGFFDDPVLDAKARNIEYKDPKVEEWERFQKEMKELATVSETIVEEDTEVAMADRQLEEIDEQLHRWNRVLEFEIKKEELAPGAEPMQTESTSSDDEMEELDLLLDWRSKGSKSRR